jgi:acyl-CoA thioester hydrolase
MAGGSMNIENYNHKTFEKVKFRDIDLVNVVNNVVYFSFFEDARIEYLHNLQKSYNLQKILDEFHSFFMAHNECDYVEPALYDDDLVIYTRIDYIKNTSFGFRHIVENAKTKHIHAKGGGVFVYVDHETKTPLPLPEEFYNAVKDYEKEVKILSKVKE